MRRLFEHITPLKLLVLLLLVNPLRIYPQGVELKRVSIVPNEGLQIFYSIDGNLQNIDNLIIRFYQDLDRLNEYTEIIIEEPNQSGNPILAFPAGFDDGSQIHIRLDLIFDDGASYRSNIHSAIFLESIESLSEACDYAINARWSNYAIYPPHLDGPQLPPIFNEVHVFIYDYDDDEMDCMLGTAIPLEPSFSQPLGDSDEIIDLSSLSDVSGGGRYCFRVRSFHNETGIESYSNMRKGIELEELVRPQTVEIRSVDVINNEAIEISVAVDNYGFSFFEYTLERTDDFNGIFEPKQSITHGGDEIMFRDDDLPHFDNNPWYYRVVADMIECPMDPPERSDMLSSVFLEAEVNFAYGSDNEVEITLEWDHYFIDGNYEYTLIKQLAGGTTTNLLNPAENSHIDILQLDQLGAEVEYIVKATRTGSSNPPVYSNYFLFSPEWLKPPPNAFRPGSNIPANQKFIPEFYFPDGIEGYSLSIFDRNGLRVFQTPPNAEPGEGWDGIIQTTGQPAPEGAYIFEISFDQADKPTRGVVYLVR